LNKTNARSGPRNPHREKSWLIKRALQMVTARLLVCGWAFIAIACSIAPSNPFGNPYTARGLNSFMGVHFGDSFDDVARRFPFGLRQTSPYGAPAYKLEKVNSRSIDYPNVTYEFAEGSGMQMVYAHFAASQSADVYQQLQTSLGAPSSADGTGEGPARVEASWQLPDGSSVFFSGPLHRLVLLGSGGGTLKPDIALRDKDLSEES
jgi:hypothetical protein